ncbi:MAG: trypsin-like peptidase domain-containing protein [Clostridiales bacterium]|jgi:serine protease Do|nr:trypsin-like peptidase domain-containing protein [Clostridiales bacterium]
MDKTNHFGEYEQMAFLSQEPAASTYEEKKAEPASKFKMFWNSKFGMLATCFLAACLFGFAGGFAALVVIAGKTEAATPETQITYVSSNYGTLAAITNDSLTNAADVVAATKQSIVEIVTESLVNSGRLSQFVDSGAGSGVIVSSDGYIVTNNHVVNGASNITVRLSNGETYPAAITGVDPKTDLAVIKINKTNLIPAVLGDSTNIRVGETSLAIGNPLGELGGTVTCGIISALDRNITIDGESMSLLQTDAAVNPGNSGGGLFNMSGEIIGIINAKSISTEIEGIGFAIPINTAKPVITDIITYGYPRGRIDTGLTVVDINNVQKAMYYRVAKLGLYVVKASYGNFKNGDRIIAINDSEVSDQASFNAALSNSKIGDEVVVTVDRANQALEIAIQLTELRSQQIN